MTYSTIISINDQINIHSKSANTQHTEKMERKKIATKSSRAYSVIRAQSRTSYYD